jgi:hypothetical protein
MAKPMKIGEAVYPTKASVEKKLREILHATQDGAAVAAEDFAFLHDVLDLHPEAESKIGCGVASFTAAPEPENRGRCFYLHRHDGTSTDWSFNSCLKAPLHDTEVRNGFSDATQATKRSYKEGRFRGRSELPCDVTGQVVRFETSDVRHISPELKALVDAFVQMQGLTLASIEVTPSSDGNSATILKDADLKAQWIAYHEAHAKLRIVARAR